MPLFEIGRLLITPNAQQALLNYPILLLLHRYQTGDWGDVDVKDWQANEHALEANQRLLSSYLIDDNTRIIMITESDRSKTTLLTPKDYEL